MWHSLAAVFLRPLSFYRSGGASCFRRWWPRSGSNRSTPGYEPGSLPVEIQGHKMPQRIEAGDFVDQAAGKAQPPAFLTPSVPLVIASFPRMCSPPCAVRSLLAGVATIFPPCALPALGCVKWDLPFGADGEDRTLTALQPRAPQARVSTCSTTSAYCQPRRVGAAFHWLAAFGAVMRGNGADAEVRPLTVAVSSAWRFRFLPCLVRIA